MAENLTTLNDLATAEEAAALLGVSVKTLAFWRNKNRGPAYVKYARRIMYRRRDLEAFAASRVVDPAESGRAA